MPAVTVECAPLDNVIRPGAVPGPSGVLLADRRFVGQIDLRLRSGVVETAGRALGTALPVAPNSTSDGAFWRACWLGPDEWLLLVEDARRGELLARIAEGLAGYGHAATDVTDARAVLRLTGPCARSILAKGCPLDLHPRVFAPGQVAQSLLARVPVILLPLDEAGYDLFVPRSYASFLWDWLLDAGAEFGLRIEESGITPLS